MKESQVNQQEREYIEKYFDEKFKNLKELLVDKINTNKDDIEQHSTEIKKLQDKTSENTAAIKVLETRMEGIKETDKEVKATETEIKNYKRRVEDRKFDIKKLLWGIPIGVLVFIMQLLASGIISKLFP